NGGDRVGKHKYAINDSYIVGYGALKYETKEGTDYSVFPLEADTKPGEYFVTADSLNVRAGAGTSFPILGTLSKRQGRSPQVQRKLGTNRFRRKRGLDLDLLSPLGDRYRAHYIL
ncbi:MAG: SH3 domain-containing protein, partial [Clostridia bacterium]|nr:SH3 domain-containing protein [Clostridia bacterium]